MFEIIKVTNGNWRGSELKNKIKFKKYLSLASGLVMLLLFVLAVPIRDLAADTKLGNYEEAPYKDVVSIKKVDWCDGRFSTVVEIPYEYTSIAKTKV
ncbi:MAG: hypothetical protein PWQ96_153 [Clostridia bacterium]|nr:hypothetical protein [Clostridia bacterium]